MNTTPATTAATTAKNNINSTFAQILKPLITLDTVGLANETLLAKRTIENGLKGINIGLEIKLQEKVKDTITTGFNLGLAIKQKVGEIQAYSVGGFPEDGLFYANHTELVGQFSNGKTAVANNEQITAGIEEAAYRGMMRALSESGGGAIFRFTICEILNSAYQQAFYVCSVCRVFILPKILQDIKSTKDGKLSKKFNIWRQHYETKTCKTRRFFRD